MRPVKGQSCACATPRGPGLLERVVRWGSRAPATSCRAATGATCSARRRRSAGFDTAVTALGVHDLLRDAAELVPGVLELEIEEALAGLRPGTPDNAPILGRSRRDPTASCGPPGTTATASCSRPSRPTSSSPSWRASRSTHAFGARALRRAGGRGVIVLNGEPRERDGATIVELLADLGVEARARGVAVAVDGEVVPRAEWATHRVDDGRPRRGVSAIQGG